MSPSRNLLLAFPAALMLAGQALADDPGFASRREAMDYLAQTLPRATAENPNYRTLADGTVSQWLTQEVRFSGESAVRIEMRESYTQNKDGKTIPGAHAAAFSLAQVKVTEFAEPGDATPDGAPARGVLFSCLTPGCVAAAWGGQASSADKTDIYLQDDATRARILAAFRYLQTSDK